ncbi:hypothetical protein VKT23_003602 [Stygiomarasmius scandens]|uniref:Uncharacterized protein n=1 Tax=Marasmiellus scandens TaxID=2682957 RepID=A0ABR1JXQ9_9AGAR
MSVKQGNLAVPPSLPSFASTFSSKSLSTFSSDDNSLPPIQSRSSIQDLRRVKSPSTHHLSRTPSHEDSLPRTAGRKRPRAESSAKDDNDHSDSDGGSPRVKEEPEQDMLEPSPPPPSFKANESRIIDNAAAPPPSTILPSPLKKRRVTISGTGTPALDTDVRPPETANSTPISPAVLGFTIPRENMEQVRSMISVKQKQQALIEQRRGSITTPAPAPEERSGAPAKSSASSSRPLRRSPNAGGSSSRRHTVVSTSLQVPTSPKPPLIPGQQSSASSQPPTSSVPAQSLPPPPISFARRRANQLGAAGKKKPADILISPREAQTAEQFAPSIQSAPPVPQAGQGNNFIGRFPMALPRLPSVMAAGDNVRRTTSGNVPPTPTRFSAQRNTTSTQVSHPIPGISGRSPPNASVPISSTLVPPTPSSLHHPGYTGEKSAFLAPFEMFYDALNDSKQLKNWLSEQMQRSNSLIQNLTQQQEKMHEIVDTMVEKRVSGMRSEMSSLQRRVEELEDALRVATSSRRGSIENGLNIKGKGKQPLRNGLPAPGPVPVESYTFPPVSSAERERRRVDSERVGRTLSPGWNHDREFPDNEGSPAPFDSRRLSVSADRSTQPRTSFFAPSPPRESPHGKLSRPGSNMSRQHSSPRIPHISERDKDRSPPRRLDDNRRNSIPGHISDDKDR